MKKALFILLVLTLSVQAFSQKWTRAQDAQKYIGSAMNIVGVITNINYVKDSSGYTVFMKMDAKDFSRPLTLVLQTPKQPRLASIKTVYLDQYVHVKGRIDLYKGNTQIKIYNASQLSVVKEAPTDDVWPK